MGRHFLENGIREETGIIKNVDAKWHHRGTVLSASLARSDKGNEESLGNRKTKRWGLYLLFCKLANAAVGRASRTSFTVRRVEKQQRLF